MRYASIDIGTNTILMLIADIDDSMRIDRVEDFYEVPRVGKNVSVTKHLDKESILRGLGVIARYTELAREHGVEMTIASATSAVRDADNREDFISPIREKFGIDVEVIDGPTEANAGYLGALSGAADPTLPALVIDIGGGSTELSFGNGMKPSILQSVDVGAVRVTERFYRNVPPDSDDYRDSVVFIDTALGAFPFSSVRPRQVFAAAGTATTLALIDQGKYDFDLGAVSNYRMNTSRLRRLCLRLRTMTPDEIKKTTSAAEGREDVLLAGATILLRVLELSGTAEFYTTDRGLRYGYLIYRHRKLLGR